MKSRSGVFAYSKLQIGLSNRPVYFSPLLNDLNINVQQDSRIIARPEEYRSGIAIILRSQGTPSCFFLYQIGPVWSEDPYRLRRISVADRCCSNAAYHIFRALTWPSTNRGGAVLSCTVVRARLYSCILLGGRTHQTFFGTGLGATSTIRGARQVTEDTGPP